MAVKTRVNVRAWSETTLAGVEYYVDGQKLFGVGGSIPLAQLADWTRGDLIVGGAAQWEDFAHPGAAGYILQTTALDMAWTRDLSDLQSIQFDLTPTVTPAEGLLYWNGTDKTLNITMAGGNVNLQVGQEMLIRAQAAETILNGQLVYISSGTGSQPVVSLAKADAELTSAATIAMATENIVSGHFGYATTMGLVRDVNTNAYTAGTILYLSAATAGAYTSTAPTAPNHLVVVGVVVRQHATEGVIYVRIENGFELSELHDVLITGAATGDQLDYDSTGPYWKNVPGLKKDIYRFGFVTNYAGTQETTIAFDGTNTFTLAPTGTVWSYYRNGTRYTINGSKTVTLSGSPPAAKGLYYIYIDGTDGALTSGTASWTLEDTKVPVAYIAWDNSLTPKYWMADERHTCAIDRRFHWEHHFSDGTEIVTPTTLTGLSVAPSSPTDANNTPGMSACVISDEDLKHSLAALTDPEGLSADYVVFYRTAAATWNWAASLTPFRYTASGYIQYDNAGTMTEGQNAKFYNTYLLLTNITGAARYVWMHGQAEFSTLAAAQNEKFQNLTRSGINVAEFVAVYQLTWQTNSSYSTLGKCRLAATPVPIIIAAAAGTATGGATTWGTITGTISDQTDLYNVIRLSNYATDGALMKKGAGLLTISAAENGELATLIDTGHVLTVAADDDYTITVSGSCVLNDWFDQSVKAAASPTFANPSVTSITTANTGLHVLDTNASHDLIIAPGSDLTADRQLTLTTGDAARTITLSGNPTLSDWFDQSVKAAATPTFANIILTDGGYIGGASTARIVIDSSGATDYTYIRSSRVIVNTATPIGAQLDVAASGTTGIFIERASGASSIKAGPTDGYMMIDSNGQQLRLNNYVADNIVLANGGGSVGIGTTSPDSRLDIADGALTMAEMSAPSAPAANGVVIYAEDNGAGKTRLMALFATGAAQQIAIQP